MDTNPPAVVLALAPVVELEEILDVDPEADVRVSPGPRPSRVDLDPGGEVDRVDRLGRDRGGDGDLDRDFDLDRDRDPDRDLDLDLAPSRVHPLPHAGAERARPRTALALALLVLLAGCAGSSAAHPRAHEQVARGYDWIAKDDLERAGVAFEHALEFAPELAEAQNGLGIVARLREDLPAARARFERAIHANADFAEGHANLGETLLAMGRDDLAVAALERALSIDPDLADARQNLARALLRRGLAAGGDRTREWTRARREYLHLLESDAKRGVAYADLAFMDYSAGRYEDAERAYRRATELEPGSRDALHGLCNSLVRLGRCEEAVRACERCLEVAAGADACRVSLRGARSCAPLRSARGARGER